MLGKSKKLSPRFCGPFEILKRTRQVAYELELHEDWKIYNVFLMGLLKKYVYLEEKASWERELDFRKDHPNFLIEDNDF